MLKKRFFKTKDECEVAFELELSDVASVDLVCEHNGWDPIPMKKSKAGKFRTKVRMPKEGSYEFRYLVDGQSWANDETADAHRPNRFGGKNSVVDTEPAP